MATFKATKSIWLLGEARAAGDIFEADEHEDGVRLALRKQWVERLPDRTQSKPKAKAKPRSKS